MEIPIFRLRYSKEYRQRFYQLCEEIFDRAYLTNDRFVREFEEKFALWTQSPHALSTSNGTSALELLLQAYGVVGGEVIVSTNTFIATALAVIRSGGKPVLCEIEPHWLSLDPEKVKDLISPRTRALVVTHIGGIITPHIKDLQDLCREHGIALFEDCAHGHGSTFDGVHCGNFGWGGAFSFFTTKVLTTGEGGVAVTQSKELYDKMVSLRQFGKTSTNPHLFERLGYNMKMTEFQAALGILELEQAHEKIVQRRKVAQIYQERLEGTVFRPIKPPPQSECGYYKQILWPEGGREALTAYLSKEGISLTGNVYSTPLHRQPVFAKEFRDEDFPVANLYSEQHICPPCYADLSEEEAHMICSKMLCWN